MIRHPILAGLLLALAACVNAPVVTGSAPAAAASAPGSATASAPHAAARSASGASGAAAAASAPVPGQPPTFAAVIKDAKAYEGLIRAYQKDEKFWLELAPEDFGKPFFLSPKIATGIGEASIFGGLMDEPQLVEFRRVHNQVQLIAVNTEYAARAGTPEGRAVAAAFSPSLLGSTAVASQPHPERKSVLVEANPLFVSDLLAIGAQLQRAYRQGYSFDVRNSAITRVRDKADLLVVEVQAHYATGTIAVPQPGSPPGAPVPTTPHSLPDPRSLFVGFHYSLSALPAQPMASRRADARVGYFETTVDDYSDDLARTPRRRMVNRWRLEKKDPAAALSEPVKPIVYWLDHTIPVKYRGAIRAGILEWNKAFERIGFRNAIEVKEQQDEPDFDTLDSNVASVRWMTNSQPRFGAIGPSHVDPRSGEILDADIGIESLSSRNLRATRSQILTAGAELDGLLQIGGLPDGRGAAVGSARWCEIGAQAGEQLAYGLDVLDARGEVDPDSPQARQFVLDYLKDVTMHEVGHTLGLRHNFRGSRIYTEQQVSDPEFTRTHALTGSVMEYAPINLAAPGEPGGTPFQSTLGPYDYWAIAYAYKPIAPESEAAELEAIAARNTEPELAYGTDEDTILGLDPESLQNDLGSDPVVFADKRLRIARDLFKRQASRTLPPDQDFAVLRRSLNFALRDVTRAAGILLRQIGGVKTLRDHPGSGRDPMQPLPGSAQRAALDALSRSLLAADSLSVPPSLQRRLAPDFLDRWDAVRRGDGDPSTDFSPQQAVAVLQRTLVGVLMSDGMAARLLDNEAKFDKPAEALHLADLYQRLDADIWSELAAPQGDIVAARRELQREHASRLAALLLRPVSLSRADARSLVRPQAQSLLARIDRAAKRPGLGTEARAHLADSAESLRSALAAGLQRTGS